MTLRTHEYMGRTIEPCERAHGEHRGRWIVRSYHRQTGMLYADELCGHYPTLAAAQEAIRIEAQTAEVL